MSDVPRRRRAERHAESTPRIDMPNLPQDLPEDTARYAQTIWAFYTLCEQETQRIIDQIDPRALHVQVPEGPLTPANRLIGLNRMSEAAWSCAGGCPSSCMLSGSRIRCRRGTRCSPP